MSLKGKLQFASCSDTGRVRSHNEDAIGMDIDTGLLVLADGMGGYKAGEVASALAVQTITSEVAANLHKARRRRQHPGELSVETVVLRDAIVKANEVIYQTAKSQPQCEGMGTTVVACLFHDNRVSIAHVGDSRLYRLRGDRFEQVTLDHSLLQELVSRGFYTAEEARKSLNKNLVTRALGIEAAVQVDVQEDVVLPGEIWLLCSDGLSDMVEDEDMHLALVTFNDNLDTAAKQLVGMANANGGRDNISVVMARALKPFPGRQGILDRFMDWFN
ncbi:MAG TPA: Stp1/IreP family PP2C-type Ser/Thr phosphatase [Gammaproteobacteria bacterium]|nr:Stp1/IreP family PP2C-type Ser/Thr phosphatase [Gammaproteobacteria bacterium]